jgi:hypothetical protein
MTTTNGLTIEPAHYSTFWNSEFLPVSNRSKQWAMGYRCRRSGQSYASAELHGNCCLRFPDQDLARLRSRGVIRRGMLRLRTGTYSSVTTSVVSGFDCCADWDAATAGT